MQRPGSQTTTLALLAMAATLGAGLAYAYSDGWSEPRRHLRRPPDDAPGRTARRRRFGRYAVVGRTVTINRPRPELYAYWRDFSNLAQFMDYVKDVRPGAPGHDVWSIAAPAGRTIDLETEVFEDRENELIAWRSVPGAQIESQGRVTFRDAPGNRGTFVEAIIAYKPPAGELGRVVAKLFQHEPNIQVRRELKRFKMLMETGEIATARNRCRAA